MTPFPTFDLLSRCQEECQGILSSCIRESPSSVEFVCHLNLLLFLGVVFFAVLTGLGVPILMLTCYLSEHCRRLFYGRRSSDLERQRLNPRSVIISCSEDATASAVRHDISRYPGARLSNPGVRF